MTERSLLLAVLLASACGRIGFDPADDTLRSLGYKPVHPVYIVGYPIETIEPVVDGVAMAYSIDPPLPAGLDLDPLTGLITGTPTVAQPPTIHNVIVTNGDLQAGTRIRIRTAEGYVVNSSLDDADAQPGDGLCETGAGIDVCTLRAAFTEIDTAGGAKTVAYIPARSITLGSVLAGVTTSVELVGEGTDVVVIDGNGASALSFGANGAELRLGYLTYRNAQEIDHGFRDDLVLHIDHVRLTDNDGVIEMQSTGVATIVDSTLDGNRGPVLYTTGGMTTIERSTISGNTLNIDGTVYFSAGSGRIVNTTFVGNSGDFAAVVLNNSTVVFTNNTFADNVATAQFYGGAVTLYTGSTSTWTNNLFVNNQGDVGQCSLAVPMVTSGGGNLAWPATAPCFNDLAPADPLLLPLGNNGGPTQTLALQPGSPAIDTGVAGACTQTDQREIMRPQGAGCDVGAFEKK